jgi:hypothetical protein
MPFLPEAWRSEVCRGFEPASIAREMLTRGFLIANGDGKPAKQMAVPGTGKPKLYCLAADILSRDENPGCTKNAGYRGYRDFTAQGPNGPNGLGGDGAVSQTETRQDTGDTRPPNEAEGPPVYQDAVSGYPGRDAGRDTKNTLENQLGIPVSSGIPENDMSASDSSPDADGAWQRRL